MDGFDAPSAPALGDRLRESGIQAAETAIAGLGLGARQYAEGAAYRGLGRGEAWLDRTLRIPRTREGLAPPPDEAAVDPQIIGGPSEGAALQEARAIQDIEAFAQAQMAEAEAKGFASAAGRGCGSGGDGGGGRRHPGQRRQGGARNRGGGGRRDERGRGRRRGSRAGGHSLGHRGRAHGREPPDRLPGRRGGGTDSDQSRSSGAVDIQTLNGMQESGVQQHFAMHQQRQRPEVIRIDSDSDSAPKPSRRRGSAPGRRGSSPRPSGSTRCACRPAPSGSPAAARAPG